MINFDLSRLQREHVEAYCVFVPTRRWRGQRACENQIGSSSVIAGLVAVRGFLDDIAAWGWSAAPARRLMFAADVPRPPHQLPRALAPDTDAALMDAVADLPDLFARVALMMLRGTGLRMGEMLDLELDCVVDYGPTGHWLRVPLGKLNSERSIPLDEATLGVLTQWKAQRGTQRGLPHQRDGRMVDFLFVEHGRRPGRSRIKRGLADAVRTAGLTGADGQPLHVTAHQLRHCYATALANSGMSIQGLMALLAHTTPEMTLRYATLASPTLRTAYETAMGRMRPRLPIAPIGKPMVPDRVQWLNAEVLKTRVAHGFCSRELAAEACPTPTSARPARTSFPQPSSPRPCRPSSQTSARYARTPLPVAGPLRSPAISGSSTASKPTSADYNQQICPHQTLDPRTAQLIR